ncbi:MAG: hypothetical protein QCI82_02070 [Candidatus Thermoplasmatota archaeon]|nr:hypothetical protein [Candidatus Thermoplasmatota archaeon]
MVDTNKEKNFIRCHKCVMPTTLPSVKLDDRGVCNNCNYYEKLLTKLDNEKEERKKKLDELVLWAKKKKRPYDCVVPLSGGKDSVYCLYLADKVYGMKSLSITFDNGLLSDHAKQNIRNAINKTGSDHLIYGPNPKEMMELYGLFLRKTGTFCPPCMRGIEIVSKMGADMFDVPLIIKGTGARYSYLARVPELFQNGDAAFFSRVVENEKLSFNVDAMKQFTVKWDLKRIVHLSTALLRIPDPTTPRHVSIYDHLGPSYDEILGTIKKEMGWTEPSDQVEHMDCKASKIASYAQSKKAKGLSDATCKNSSLIRLGSMKRDEAMLYEKNYNDENKDPPNLDWFLCQIGMSRDEFEGSITDWRTIQSFRDDRGSLLNNVYLKLYNR